MALTNVSSGCTKVSKVLTANLMEVTIWCAGQSKLGIGVPALSAGQVLGVFGSLDGLTFNPLAVGAYPEVIPPPAVGAGTTPGQTTITAAGNYEVPVQNYLFIRVQLVTGNGNATVIMAASVDSSYQEAFLVGQSGVNLTSTLYPSTTSSSGTNTQTIPGQANRTVNLTYCEISMVGPNFGNAQVKIWDGSVGNGVPLYSCFLTANAGSVGSVQLLNLPTDAQGNKGVQGTPGNAMVVQIVNVGTATIINSRASML